MAFKGKIACLLIMGLALGAGGCSLLGSGGKKVSIQDPPYIPAPPAQTDMQPQAPGMYADIAALDDANPYHPDLKEAVQVAINHGILKPRNKRDNFMPDQAVTYAEFREWVNAYSQAQTAATMPEAAPALAPGEAPLPTEMIKEEPLKMPEEDAGQVEEASDARRLPPNISWDGHKLKGESPVSREELAALYVTLSDALVQAQSLTPGMVDQMRPEGAPAAESLGQFKDGPAIGDWARKYVALAYRDGILKDIFGLTPARLVELTGFQPAKPVNRAEALVLLHHFFKLPEKPPPPPEATTEPGLPAGESIVMPNPEHPTEASQPKPSNARVHTPD